MRLLRLIAFVVAASLALTTFGSQAAVGIVKASVAAQSSYAPMNCCPDKHPASDGAECPLMALCATVVALPTAPAPIATPAARVTVRPRPADEPAITGRGAAPPLEPPRS